MKQTNQMNDMNAEEIFILSDEWFSQRNIIEKLMMEIMEGRKAELKFINGEHEAEDVEHELVSSELPF